MTTPASRTIRYFFVTVTQRSALAHLPGTDQTEAGRTYYCARSLGTTTPWYHLVIPTSDPRSEILSNPALGYGQESDANARRLGIDPNQYVVIRMRRNQLERIVEITDETLAEALDEPSPAITLDTSIPEEGAPILFAVTAHEYRGAVDRWLPERFRSTVEDRTFFAVHYELGYETTEPIYLIIVNTDHDERADALQANLMSNDPERAHYARRLGLDPASHAGYTAGASAFAVITALTGDAVPDDDPDSSISEGEPEPEITEAHRRDIEIITNALHAVARRREWCGEFEDLLAEVNRELTVKVEPRTDKRRVTVTYDVETPFGEASLNALSNSSRHMVAAHYDSPAFDGWRVTVTNVDVSVGHI